MRALVLVCCEYFSEKAEEKGTDSNIQNKKKLSFKESLTFTIQPQYDMDYFEEISRHFADLSLLKRYQTGNYEDIDS